MKRKLPIVILGLLLCYFTEAQTTELFGVTSNGGADNKGVIFKTDASGENQTVLYQLKVDEGNRPDNSKLCEVNGKLYGTTGKGGLNDMGVIYEYNLTTGAYTKLHDFDGVNSGRDPYSNVILATNGKLYGTTLYGGISDFGTLFEYDIETKKLTKKLDFDGVNMGKNVYANVIQATNGKLYGLTNRGGAYDAGVLYEYDYTSEVFTNLLDFQDVSNGRSPTILVEVENNVLYGTGSGGGINGNGTLFEYNILNNTFTKKFDFNGVASGSNPILSLMIASNGNLYGLTRSGGENMFGVLYEYNISTQTFTKKLDFTTEIGTSPSGDLLEVNNGKLYGLAQSGGLNNRGVIFEFDPATDGFTKKLDFETNTTGSTPNGSFMQASNNKLYATTRSGGLGASGVLFEFDTQTGNFDKKIDFNYTNTGFGVRAGFAKGLNNKLYLVTGGGGKYLYGTLLEFDPFTNILIKKFDFSLDNAPQGAVDAAVLYASNNKIYGVSAYYGGKEVLFEFDLQSNTYATKVSFNNAVLGENPTELIEASNGKIYGMTSSGGINNHGVIFEYDFVDNAYTKLFDFNGTITGRNPRKALFQGSNGKLYGMTANGGANNKGTLFEFDFTTNTFTKKFDFSTQNPGNGDASLIELDSGILYGFTNSGGLNSVGTIFEFNLNTDTYTKKYDFDNLNTGYLPEFRFLKTSENKLFGLNNYGGANGFGVLFEFNPSTNVFTKKLNFNSEIGIGPKGSLVEVITNSLSNEDNHKLTTVRIYPNPVSDKLIVSSKSPEAFQIKIYDFLGKQVFLKNHVFASDELKLTQLKSGLYFLKATSKSGNTQTIKFIKN